MFCLIIELLIAGSNSIKLQGSRILTLDCLKYLRCENLAVKEIHYNLSSLFWSLII